jgi:histidine triad (HIT) family protein
MNDQICPFCQVISGTEEYRVLKRTEHAIAFLDHQPAQEGRTLVMPANHYEHVFELPPDTYQEVMELARHMALVLQKVYKVERMGLLVAGVAISHAHVHVYPLNGEPDLATGPQPILGEAELIQIAEKIRQQEKDLSR